jgi:L-threonylcarbamoyladenylate synthase
MPEVRILPISPAAIAEAATYLRAGRLVAFPTETVYGLGGNALDDHAVAGIFAAKGRPDFNPLIVHTLDVAAARTLARFDERAERLAQAFWPGPLTLVLARRPDCPISPLASAGLETLALRVPKHAAAQALLRSAGVPLAAPSANPSGRVSPTTAAHVAAGLGEKLALILDGGPCTVGLESTVIGLSGPKALLLRPGGVTQPAIEAVIGPLAQPDDARVQAPGMLASHYAPRLPLRLGAVAVSGREALLAFGPAPLAGAARTLNLSPAGDITEAAAHLFAYLHTLDEPGLAAIAVMPIPEHGLGQAINDRLRRAAAPRS